MDEKGFIFTVDSILMLIPIFIIIATVSGISLDVPHESPYYAAQDAMDSMLLIATNQTDDSLNTIARNITSGNMVAANNSANSKGIKDILNSYKLNYNLTYFDNSTSTFKTLISNDTMSTANGTISTSTRTHYNVIFRLYMWR
jgi:hypothetical protein